MSDERVDNVLELSRQLLREIQALEYARQEARTIEWQASPRSLVEGRRGGKALHHDPTALVATDEHRLRVRDALRASEEDLIRAKHHVLAAKGRIGKAVDGWRGPQ